MIQVVQTRVDFIVSIKRDETKSLQSNTCLNAEVVFFKFLSYLNVVNERPGASWSLYAQDRVRAKDLSYEEMTS